jgi:Phosphatidylinositolglycan class N (PIG-N)
MAVILTAVLYIQRCPLIYYAYAGFPVFFWEEVLASRGTLIEGLKVLMKGDRKQVSPMTVAFQSILYIGILESLVLKPLVPSVNSLGIWILSQTYFQYLFYFCRDVAIYIWVKVLEK